MLCRLRSRDFVQIFVGPNEEIRLVPMGNIFDRRYFRDQRRGLNLFTLTKENIWRLEHPKLETINPRDFDFVVEFLTSGDFGHRVLSNGEERDEAFAECVSAWKSAELLDMDDLLDHITEKLEHKIRPWDMFSVITFARDVYNPLIVNIPAHDKMKALLATFIAENFWGYIVDDALRSKFVKRLRQFPELDRDVQGRRHPTIQPQAGLLEDDVDE